MVGTSKIEGNAALVGTGVKAAAKYTLVRLLLVRLLVGTATALRRGRGLEVLLCSCHRPLPVHVVATGLVDVRQVKISSTRRSLDGFEVDEEELVRLLPRHPKMNHLLENDLEEEGVRRQSPRHAHGVTNHVPNHQHMEEFTLRSWT